MEVYVQKLLQSFEHSRVATGSYPVASAGAILLIYTRQHTGRVHCA
jgi:hypothetical protein